MAASDCPWSSSRDAGVFHVPMTLVAGHRQLRIGVGCRIQISLFRRVQEIPGGSKKGGTLTLILRAFEDEPAWRFGRLRQGSGFFFEQGKITDQDGFENPLRVG